MLYITVAGVLFAMAMQQMVRAYMPHISPDFKSGAVKLTASIVLCIAAAFVLAQAG
jgi:hypothetical protein